MEEHKDPLSLWVGSWSPEEVVERKTPRGKTQDPALTNPRVSKDPQTPKAR